MLKIAHSSAAVSVCNAALAWLPTFETSMRVIGAIVAVVAGVLSILVHIRTLRKQKAKK